MADTLDRLMQLHGRRQKRSFGNTIPASAMPVLPMAEEGMVNVGQLVRERHGEENVVLVGFGSYRGSVVAAVAWEAPMEVMPVPEAAEESWEEILHRLRRTIG